MAFDFLLDSFKITGTTLKEFKKIAKEIDEATQIIPLNFSHADVYHLLSVDKSLIKYSVFSAGNNFNVSNSGALIVGKTARVKMDYIYQYYPDFFNEIVHENKTMLRLSVGDEGKFYFFGETFYKTFSAQTSCIGGFFLKECSIERDIALSKIFTDEMDLNTLVRSNGKIHKIFGVFSDKFCRVPLDNIAQCITHFNDSEVKFWEINQKETQIYIEFPKIVSSYDKPSIIPGIRITTSDTGYSQTDIELCFRNANGKAENYHRIKKTSFKHIKEISINDLISEIENMINEAIFITEKFMTYRKSIEDISIKGINAYKRTINELLSMGYFKEEMGVKTQKDIVSFLTQNSQLDVKKSKILDEIIALSDINNTITAYQKEKFRNVLGNIIKNVA